MDPFYRKILSLVIIVIIAIVAVSIVSQSYQTIPAGYEGVILNWGNPVGIVGPGLHLITPFAESIVPVNTQVQTAIISSESASSSDLQEVTTSVTVNYQLDAAYALEIYTNLRNTYQNSIIIPLTEDALKATTANYQASELITSRDRVKSDFQTLLQTKLESYHINVISTSITNFAFSTDYQSAIDAKTTAQQNALAAQNQLQVVNFTAQQQIIQANANATAIILQAQGKANATVIAATANEQAIQLITSQLNPSYIQYLYAIGWNGQLPIYWVSGNGTAPYLLVTLPSNTTASSSTPSVTNNATPANSASTSTPSTNGLLQSVPVYENTTSSSVGDTIKLTAIISTPEAGITVSFFNNGDLIGTATTNSAGDAIYNFVRTDLSNYTFTGTATY